ncbi:hypothetical protein AXI59_04250 [Bacillus nakamurai]|uniref:Uncharacterized protein n=1 Tax=Bacillus nakamurai TaxID=1793963 RepID=A0A150FB31_9BACI|nr:hypothetical protein AXI59_04250 [Bacillus nakamurai]KXZ22457.1 hypothetical protein AXI58_10795 [Bacillus nakamurai]MCP6684169.1 spore coat protein C [Bacillus nakamurai]
MGEYKKYKEVYFSGKITFYKKDYDDNKKHHEKDKMYTTRNKHDDKYDYIVEYKRNCNRNNCK